MYVESSPPQRREVVILQLSDSCSLRSSRPSHPVACRTWTSLVCGGRNLGIYISAPSRFSGSRPNPGTPETAISRSTNRGHKGRPRGARPTNSTSHSTSRTTEIIPEKGTARRFCTAVRCAYLLRRPLAQSHIRPFVRDPHPAWYHALPLTIGLCRSCGGCRSL